MDSRLNAWATTSVPLLFNVAASKADTVTLSVRQGPAGYRAHPGLPPPPALLPRALPGLSWEQVVVSPSPQGLLVARRTRPKSRGLCSIQGMSVHDKY